MVNKLFGLLFALIFCIALVSAVPPVTQVGQLGSLDIAYPQYQYVKLGSNFTMYIHVYNTTNYLTGTMATCYLDLYNAMGQETCHSKLTAGSSDYYVDISAGNFTVLGVQSFVIQCNSTSQTGFANGVFEVNQLGRETTQSDAILYSLFMLAIIIIFFAFLYGSIMINGSGNDSLENLEINWKKYVKWFCMAFTYVSFIWFTHIAWSISYGILRYPTLSNIFRMLFLMSRAIGIPVLTFMVVYGLVKFYKDLAKQKIIDRGMA